MNSMPKTTEGRSGITFLIHSHVQQAWNELLARWGESDASGFSRLTERATRLPVEELREAYDSLPEEPGAQKNVRAGTEARQQLAELAQAIGADSIGRTIEATILVVHRHVLEEDK